MTEIRIELDSAEALRKLEEFEREVEEAEEEAQQLQQTAGGLVGPRRGRLAGRIQRPAGGGAGAAAGFAGKLALLTVTIGLIWKSVQVIQAGIDALGQSLSKVPGFEDVGDAIQKGAASGARGLGQIAGIAGAFRGIEEGARPFARAGLGGEIALLEILNRFRNEAVRDFQAEQRKKAKDTVDMGKAILDFASEL